MNVKALYYSLIFSCITLVAQSASAETTSWSKIQTSVSPPGRLRHALTYDVERQKAVLFGGTGVLNGSFVVLGDTWIWNSTTKAWEGPLNLTPSPSARYGSAMVYDSARGVVVLFGGSDSNNVPLSDTWEFNGSIWTQVTPARSPFARTFHALSYDSVRQKTILFGGLNGSILIQDTWAWDGAEWTQLSNNGPSARELHSLSYDQIRNKVYLFGGFQSSKYLNDLWELDGSNWKLNDAIAPEARIESPFTYDPKLNQSILFGGLTEAGMPLGDTWSWDGTTWQSLLAAGPSPRRGAVTTYDSKLSGIILFGGADNNGNVYGDTWLFSAIDSDNDGITDYLDQCPADPLKTISGVCGCGTADNNLACSANIKNIKPNRPILKMNKQKLRIKMQAFSNISYRLTYYEKVGAKVKPKIISKKSNSSTVDISKLKNGRSYFFSYRLSENAKSKELSKVSSTVKFKIVFKK